MSGIVWRFGLCWLMTASAAFAAGNAGRVDYLRQIKPILRDHCYACHGALKQEANLRLDTGGFARKGGDSGPAVVPRKVDKSLLLRRVTSKDSSIRMPQEGKPLSAKQIGLLKAWIAQGARSPVDEQPQPDPNTYWSFQPPKRPKVPTVRNRSWVRNPIDAFIAAQHERRGLKPNPPANNATLLRRVTIDLIGLPPTRAELRSFLADKSPNAYEKVVARLLSDPRYGQRWGRHCMDVWRYSDWHGSGNEIRYGQRHLWRWRDWIIDSLNADAGYDRMVMQMLAADEVAPTNPKVLPATGFIGRNWYKFDRNVWMRELVEHTAAGFLAVTMKCARCHDHKYDPLSQEEYYRFRAFFEPHDVRVDRISYATGTTKDNKQGAVLADGIPRVYDKTLSAPTYVFRRGDDRYPQKDRSLKPGVPNALGGTFAVKPVQLPAASYVPELRPELLAERIARAEAAVRKANSASKRAEADVVAARNRLKAAANGAKPQAVKEPFRIVYRDDFKRADSAWQPHGGKWAYRNGRLVQTQVGTFLTRVLNVEHPENLLVRVRYKPTTAGTLHSIGVGFDVVPGRHMQAIYTWIPKGRSGVSAFHRQAGKETYPTSAIKKVPLKLNEEITLDFAARGQLLNVWINGKLVIVHRMPMRRRKGKFSLWNHAGTAEYSELRISELPSTIRLAKSASEKLPSPFRERKPLSFAEQLRVARQAQSTANGNVKLAEAELAALKARIAAEQSRLTTNADKKSFTRLARIAARTERAVVLVQAEIARQQAEFRWSDLNRVSNPDNKQLAAAKKALAAATKKRDAAKAALKVNSGKYTRFAKAFPSTSTGRRSALARWIVDPKNPRTARVAVNHIWLRHFGRAFVESVSDFGLRSKPRTHPELLDWLAVELAERRWSMKHLHRLIVLSNTYRMDSSPMHSDANRRIDPDNRSLWRMNSRRMEAEVVRDTLLALSGRLDAKPGGKSIPFSQSQSVARRSVYFQTAPNRQAPFLKLFDVANPDACYRRRPSVVPQQSLALMNSRLAVDNARLLARRIDATRKSDDAFIAAAFERILSRPPTKVEFARCRRFLIEQTKQLREAKRGATFPGSSSATVPPGAKPETRARENLVHVLFNHNDFVTIR